MSSKWTLILGAGLGAYLGFNVGKYAKTPPIFSLAPLAGREGASAWKRWVFAAVGSLYSFLAQQQNPSPGQRNASTCSSLGPSGGTIPVSSSSGQVRFQFDGAGNLIGLGIQLTGDSEFSDFGITVPANTFAGFTQVSPGKVELGFSKAVTVGSGLRRAKIKSVTFSDGKFTSVKGSIAPLGVPLSDADTESSLLLDFLNGDSSTAATAQKFGKLMTDSAKLMSSNVKCKDLFGER